MNTPPALLAVLLLVVPCARAATPPAQTEGGPEDPAKDVIVPLNVRDPSALVMDLGGEPIKVSIEAPARATAAAAQPAKVAKSEVDKIPLRKGDRAVALSVDEDQLLGVKPGDHVDLLAVFETVAASGLKEKMSATVLQNRRVLAVATTGDVRGKGVLTLELNPNEAQYAALSARQADLTVAVRPPGDVEIYPMQMAGFRHLFK